MFKKRYISRWTLIDKQVDLIDNKINNDKPFWISKDYFSRYSMEFLHLSYFQFCSDSGLSISALGSFSRSS